MKIKVSVNILTWNCCGTLLESLKILNEDLRGIPHETIIIDNGSTDGSQEVATIKNSENLGVSIGKNQGLERSNGEYIFLLDGDIVPVPNSINCLIDWLDENPEEMAIGFYPNKFTDQKNKNGQKHHESYCHLLWNPKIHTQAIAFYGLFRRSILESNDIKFPTYGAFGTMGYGWEDSDFYMQMREAGFDQWVAGINHATGKYYHEINSSIRHMGQEKYIETSKNRRASFKQKWGEKEALYYA